MAARINAEINQKHRDSIRTTQLIKRLQMHALGEPDPQSGETVKLAASQIRAIEILLNRTMPTLQSIEGGLDLHHHKHEEALKDLE